jgi:hypothetical protein
MSYGLYVENQDQRILIDSNTFINLFYEAEGLLASGSAWPPTVYTPSNSLFFARPEIPAGATFPLTQHISGQYTTYNASNGLSGGGTWYGTNALGNASWPPPANYRYINFKQSSTKGASTSGYGLQIFSSTNTLVFDSGPEAKSMTIIASGQNTPNGTLLGTFSNLNKIYCCINNIPYHVVTSPTQAGTFIFYYFQGFKYVWTSSTSGSLYFVAEYIVSSAPTTRVSLTGGRYIVIQERS